MDIPYDMATRCDVRRCRADSTGGSTASGRNDRRRADDHGCQAPSRPLCVPPPRRRRSPRAVASPAPGARTQSPWREARERRSLGDGTSRRTCRAVIRCISSRDSVASKIRRTSCASLPACGEAHRASSLDTGNDQCEAVPDRSGSRWPNPSGCIRYSAPPGVAQNYAVPQAAVPQARHSPDLIQHGLRVTNMHPGMAWRCVLKRRQR